MVLVLASTDGDRSTCRYHVHVCFEITIEPELKTNLLDALDPPSHQPVIRCIVSIPVSALTASVLRRDMNVVMCAHDQQVCYEYALAA
eukprot:COSAG02_NODE_334_length_24367_cov_6.715634_16_plen_88_part_00